MRLKRIPHWERALAQFIMGRRRVPFIRGIQDCSMFACDGIWAITGTDIAADVRGKYRTEEEAQSLLQELTGGGGFHSYIQLLTDRYEILPVPVKLARRGDCVIIMLKAGPSLGIIGTDGVYALFPGESGLEQVKVLDCDGAWKIGWE